MTIEETPKAYMEALDATVEKEREAMGKKPFDPKDEPPFTRTVEQSKPIRTAGNCTKKENHQVSTTASIER